MFIHYIPTPIPCTYHPLPLSLFFIACVHVICLCVHCGLAPIFQGWTMECTQAIIVIITTHTESFTL